MENENGSDWFGCRYDHITGGDNFIFRRYSGQYDTHLMRMKHIHTNICSVGCDSVHSLHYQLIQVHFI